MALRTDQTDNPPASGGAGDNNLWLGLEEFAGTAEFTDMLHREFPEDATAWGDPVNRRAFLAVSAASVALAGIGCSPRPASKEKIYPYVKQPEQLTPGLPLFFATGYTLQGVTTGVLAKSREGRPVKIEGNPTHPASLGATDTFMQASLLNLYDPDRSRNAINARTGEDVSWETLLTQLRGKLPRTAKVRVLTETVGSPSLADALTKFAGQFADAQWVQYEPVNRDNVREGARLAFGDVVHAIYDFTKAARVVSLDGDFMGSCVGGVRYAKDFNSRRVTAVSAKDAEGHTVSAIPTAEQMNRLYVVESTLSPTGGVADHRLPMKSSEVESVARALAKAVGADAGAGGTLSDYATKWVAALAKDLLAHRGTSVVVAGDHQPPAVHAIAHAINGTLGAVGQTVRYTRPVEAKATNQTVEFTKLVADMAAGAVDALFILGGNPAYTTAATINFADALKRVPLKVHMGSHVDETAVLCDYHVNEAHYLETWGDGRAFDGTVTVSQPLIAPLFNGHSILEFVANLTKDATLTTGQEIVKAFWQNQPKDGTPADFGVWWQHVLQDGVVPGSAFQGGAKAGAASVANVPAYKAPGSGLELNLRADPNLFDGRFANNGWLQELPRPITKLTWDNAAIVSPKTAEKLGFGVGIVRSGGGEHGKAQVDMGELTVNGRKMTVPVWIQPMHVDDSITLYLGSGRERAGQVGNTGFNAYKVRDAGSDILTGAELKPTGEKYILACTQSHFSMEGRRPARSANLEEYRENPTFSKVAAIAGPEWQAIDDLLPGNEGRHKDHGHDHDHDHKPAPKTDGKTPDGAKDDHADEHDAKVIPLTMYPDTNKEGRRWAMAIDLTQCNGCSVCLVACQAENNIPVVGKTQVTKGREMHWIRVDRYYEGTDPNDAANLVAHFQPVPCQQCEKAPCEVVCPVAATIHSTDGLNDMVYNRCVGTRYCSNNCPYKVRRFNFLTFADWKTDTLKLMRNPEVTVRERGVMEKCTYCVQRIRSAEIEAERQFRGIKDGEIVTACEAACPTGAITFGDLSIPNSRVNRKKAQGNNYGLLAELNTLPRTTYLAAIRNPNPAMPDPNPKTRA